MSEAFQERLETSRNIPLAEGLPKYQHVERLGHEEVEGLLDGSVVVQEKLDGANASVAMIGGEIVVASRNRIIGPNETGMFKTMRDYVLAHDGIITLARQGWILRGEWLAKHSLMYNQDAFGHFYVFDVQTAGLYYLRPDYYEPVLAANGVRFIKTEARLSSPTIAQLAAYATGPSSYGPEREGIVIKRYDFVNKFGRTQWGKIVSADFKQKASINFGPKNHDPAEIKFAALVTADFVAKTLHKVADEKGESPRIQHMGTVIHQVWHDLFTEELYTLVQGDRVKSFNFEDARKLVERQTRDTALAYYNGVPTVHNNSVKEVTA